MKTLNQNDVRALALKILIGLPLAGFLWTIIFRFLGSSELWNWNILIVFASFAVILGGGSLAYYPFGISIYRFWNQLIVLIDLLIVWLCLPLFYYIILTPYSLVMRVIGKSNFTLTKQNTNSYWKDVAKPKNDRRYLQQF
jgi:hypothetical protein